MPGMALNYILQNNFKPNVGMRPDSRKIGVLITDGKSQDEVIVNSQSLRDSGIELYAIGEWISHGGWLVEFGHFSDLAAKFGIWRSCSFGIISGRS